MRWLWFITLSLSVVLLGILSDYHILWIFELLIIDIFFTDLLGWKTIPLFQKTKTPHIVNIFLWLTLSTLLVRIFIFQGIKVQNPGMEPLIKYGDYLLVGKLNYGPRLPLFSGEKGYKRLKGINEIGTGDLLAYNFPIGDSVIPGYENISLPAARRIDPSFGKEQIEYRPVNKRFVEISRCIGLPGDTIEFKSGLPFINGIPYEDIPSRSNYLVKFESNQKPENLIEEFDLNPGSYQIQGTGDYLIPLTAREAKKLEIRYGVNSLQKSLQPTGKGNLQVFPHNEDYQWNTDNFGPVIVPSRGDIINLNKNNLGFYKRLIETYEGNALILEDNTIYINNMESNSYEVKMDYYFVSGDNSPYSRDSRHWGFLPEDHIIGKPMLIYLSLSSRKDKRNKISWKRIMDIVK